MTSIRTTEVMITPLPQAGLYRLDSTLTVDYTHKGRHKVITVPHGYTTNGANIPKPLWVIVGSPFAPHIITAAIVHDYMYEFERQREYTPCEMSDLFREILISHGMGRVMSFLMRQGVFLYTSLIKYK